MKKIYELILIVEEIREIDLQKCRFTGPVPDKKLMTIEVGETQLLDIMCQIDCCCDGITIYDDDEEYDEC